MFSWAHCKSQEKMKQCSYKNLEEKLRALWYFGKWPIQICNKVKTRYLSHDNSTIISQEFLMVLNDWR